VVKVGRGSLALKSVDEFFIYYSTFTVYTTVCLLSQGLFGSIPGAHDLSATVY
jgi:hypothetical protein